MLWIKDHSRWLAVLLVLVASVRIASTWFVFNATTDESTHVVCGMEWLQRHTYQTEDQHPPLARVAAALGPYLLGLRAKETGVPALDGSIVLVAEHQLTRNLAAARAGILPFFWVACAVVFLWARRCLGDAGAVAALFVFTMLPPILAHGSLATTDMALTAMIGATALAALSWLERPRGIQTALFGIAGGLAMLSKFSSLPFFAAAAICMVPLLLLQGARRPAIGSRHLVSLIGAASIAATLVWGGYFFSYGKVRQTETIRPAPEFFSGLNEAQLHNKDGHTSYLLGKFSPTGFRSYYPVALAVKTPIPFLTLLVTGVIAGVLTWRKRREWVLALAFSAGILAFAIAFSRINIGIRHVLPVYIGFAIIAGKGVMTLLRNRRAAWAGAALLGWLAVSSVASHPDYLGYFNELACARPERILIDSDLDWGQDAKRLASRLQELKVTNFAYAPLIYGHLVGADFPKLAPFTVEKLSPGWHGGHITRIKLGEFEALRERPNARFWVEALPPTERIGRGILLWKVSEADAAAWNASLEQDATEPSDD